MTLKISLISLVAEKKSQMKGIPELKEFFGYLLEQLDETSDQVLGEYERNSCSDSDVLRLVAWQSVPINIEFSESFTNEAILSLDDKIT